MSTATSSLSASSCSCCSVSLFQCIRWDKASAVEFLIQHRVLKPTTACAKCGGVCELNRDSLLFRCDRLVALQKKKKARCNFNKSARVGSFLGGSHLPADVLLQLVAVFLHLKPPRQDLIERELRVSSHTVVDWYSFCREVFYHCMVKNSSKLGGVGTTVEIDEAKFGKRKYNRGRKVEGQWVFGGIQRDTRQTFL